jgi:hypothetical protein
MEKGRHLPILAVCNGEYRRVGWITLDQADQGISIGLSDRALTIRDFKAQEFVWSAFNRRTLNFIALDADSPMRSVKNPHLTFHPPHWFHLTEGTRKRKPFEAIADISLALDQQGEVPWVRFVSKAFVEMPVALPSIAANQEVIVVEITSKDRSVTVSMDFVLKGLRGPKINNVAFCEFYDSGDYTARVVISEVPGQRATLGWIHQS